MSNQEREVNRGVRKGAPHRGSRLVQADLKAYLDGELSGPRRWLVQWHLVRCAECREEITWLQRLGKNMQNLEEARPSPSLRARIMASLPDTPPPASRVAQPSFAARPGAFQRSGLRLALSMSLVVLAVGGLFALTRLHSASNQRQESVAITLHAPVQPSKSLKPDVASTTPVATTTVAKDPFRVPTPTPDPISQSATDIANKWVREQAGQAERQQQQDWSRMLTAVRFGKNESKTAPAQTVCVELAVSDVSAAHERLLAWTKRAGGTILVAKNATEIVGATGGEAFCIRVPAARGSVLLGTLKGMGEVGALRTLPLHEKTDGDKAPPMRTAAPIPVENQIPTEVPGGPKPKGNTVTPDIDMHMSVATVQGETPPSVASVTIIIVLKPVDRPSK
ncbi:MAG TPA: zf-HC2 domain-containing protein [Chthonomonadaceae bacterium]|nr:zf-HC2 domain-containing protein [Chthonomonadaceae bacterium]